MAQRDALRRELETIERDMVEKAVVQQALIAFDQVFDAAPPNLKKQFVQALVGQVRVSDLRLAIGFDGRSDAEPVHLATARIFGPMCGPDFTGSAVKDIWCVRRLRAAFRFDSRASKKIDLAEAIFVNYENSLWRK